MQQEIGPLPDAADPTAAAATPAATVGTASSASAAEPSDPVDRLLELIRSELARSTQHRLTEIEPGRWWLGDRTDRDAAAAPLADRVEWAVFSLLSTAGPLSEAAFFERIAALFTGHDLPDEALVRACLESYRIARRHPGTGSSRAMTSCGGARSTPSCSATLADGGHRLGMRVWLGRREQTRRTDGRPLGELARPVVSGDAYLARDQPGRPRTSRTWTASGTCAARWPSCSRSSGRRCSASRSFAATPGSRPTNALVRFLVDRPRADRARPLQARRARRCSGRRSTTARWHIIKCEPPARRSSPARSRRSTTWSRCLGLDPLVERTG